MILLIRLKHPFLIKMSLLDMIIRAIDQGIIGQASGAVTSHKRRRGKAKFPTNVDQVRRSSRLAGMAAGYKGKPPSDMIIPPEEEEEEEEEVDTAKNLSPEFESTIVDTSTPAPPHLPLPMLQAIGTGQCQIASTMLSEEELNYDSTNDSIESN